ncbi:MAG: hypothetical protein KC656_02500 [Myxococcales bacterium]|nr:hypothetical protein [Myxococcales bacterium]
MANNSNHEIDANTTAWTVQVWVSWVVAASMTCGGVLMLPTDWWSKGYLLMGMLFTIGSTFSLAKTTRDNAENRRLRNRIQAAKTDKILREFELSDAA